MNRVSFQRNFVACLALSVTLFVVTGPPALSQGSLARAASASANLAAARSAFEALPEAERKALQDALIWTGASFGLADGVFGRQTFDAIASWQQTRRKPPTGILNAAERTELLTLAARQRDAAGFTVLEDQRTGIRIGVPTQYLSRSDSNSSGGSRWQSADEKVTLDTRRAPPDAALEALYERNLASKAPGRVVTYKVLRPDFWVVAGETESGKFYTRYDSGVSGLRGFSIGYDKSLAPQVDRLVVAIANSFEAFPSALPPSVPADTPPARQPETASPGRRLIGTAIAVTANRVFSTVSFAACRDPEIGGIRLSPAQPPEAGKVTGRLIDLPGSTSGALAPVTTASAQKHGAVLVLGYVTDRANVTLSVVPGVMADERSLLAPLQPGFGGAPVFDAQNNLVGLVTAVTDDGRKIAGIATTARFTLVPPDDLPPALQAASGHDARKPDAGSASDLVSTWKGALLPITCQP